MNPLAVLASVFVVMTGVPQQRGPEQTDSIASPDPLASLVQRALEQNPRLGAARDRVRAAETRIAPAGSLPDPMLSLSLRNFPASDPGFQDFMTMKSLGLSQRLTYPGKRTLAVTAATREVVAANAALQDLRLDVTRRVRQSYYELAFIDNALEVVGRHAEVLSELVTAADTRYAVGSAGQEDVLSAQVETAALADEAARLTETRHGALAGLNRLLNLAPDTPLAGPEIPEAVVTAGVRTASRVSFVSMAPGARVADSPLRPLAELLEAMVLNNPGIAVDLARIEAQEARVELAQKAHLPDIDVALSYGQRNGRSDMVSLSFSLPLPLNRGARQDAWSAEAAAELAALEADHQDHVNELRTQVSEIYADLERDRSGLALLTVGMIPQGGAALSAATAGFQVSRTDFQTVLANQATLFQFETSYYRTLTDFAQHLAELEWLVGEEVLR
jgi:outer membrane protein, heavy metal efflux system